MAKYRRGSLNSSDFFMLKVVLYPDIIPWFKKRGCEAGITFTYNVCELFYYAMYNFNLKGEIRSYMSSKLNTPMINVDFHEYMDQYTQQRTYITIDQMVGLDIAELMKVSEYECMYNQKITIPIVYSFFNKVVS